MVKSGVSRFTEAVKALLGVSTFQQPPQGTGYSLDDPEITKMRDQMAGGQLAALPVTQTRWYLADLETAQRLADTGDISKAAKLWSAMRSDGKMFGLRRTLAAGVVGLPRRFRSPDKELADAIDNRNENRSDFDDMFPPAECGLFVDDMHGLGVAVAELVPVAGRDLPRFTRLDPEFLWFNWSKNTWYYKSIFGNLAITPGDGRWILGFGGGIVNPWRNGIWRALGRSYINKEHAMLHRSNYSSKLANPARAAVAPPGATEPQRIGMLARLMAWGLNTVFELPVGWDVKLIESNGRGFQVFQDEIKTSDEEAEITVAGQTVTTDGGAGFSNADVHEIVRQDIIDSVAKAWAHVLNTQGLTVYSWIKRSRADLVTVEYVTEKPKDREAQGRTMQITANGVGQLTAALGPYRIKPNVSEILTQFGIPFEMMTEAEFAEWEARTVTPMSPTETAQQVSAAGSEDGGVPKGRNGERGSKSDQKATRESGPGGSDEAN